MIKTLSGISSMATRQVLADLATAYQQQSGHAVRVESVGGVDAERRVRSGEAFDWVALASEAIDRLIASGQVRSLGRVDLVRSPVAVAVRAGASRPDVATEAGVRQAVLSARSVSTSTGPSGTHLRRLFESWGIAGQISDRLVQAPSGVPVGTLVAQGEVELGFQQLSELIHVQGISVLGTLPPAIEFITTFSAGLCAGTSQADAVRDMFNFMTSQEAAATKRRHGLEPA